MHYFYQVRSYSLKIDKEFDDEQEAISFAETLTHCELITWRRERNMPYCKPDFVDKSCSLKVWDNGQWKGVNIHTW